MAVWERAGVHSPTFAASRPDIDVAVLQYGTNDAPHIDGRLDDYLAALRSALRQFRVAYPGVRCVLIGPPDRGGQARGIDHSLLHTLVARAQQRVGREFDCDFWDWQAQMGGRGSAAAGVARTPPVMHRDRVHMTSLGYRDSGLAFGSWLMQHRL